MNAEMSNFFPRFPLIRTLHGHLDAFQLSLMRSIMQVFRRTRFCLVLLIVVFICQPIWGQPADKYTEPIKAFEEFVKTQMEADRMTGLSVAFMKDDFVWAKGYGYADLENQVPATEKSAYRLASVTKPMTATAIMQLVEKGKIDLDAEVQTYAPYFPRKPWPVTVRQLLGHLGGISHYKNYDLEGHFKEHKNTRDAIAIFDNFDLGAEPGTKYNYSSYGYNLLGAVIEGASGQSYGEYMRQNIWEPLGMTETRMDDPLDVIPHRVRGYQLVDGKIKNSEFVDISSRFAAGGTRSTVLDLLKFAKGLNDRKILSESSIALMYESMATKDGRLTGYGMGWGTDNANGRFFVSHSGGQQETRTILYNFPTRNLIVAAGCNFEGGNPTSYARRLIELILDEPMIIHIYAGDKINLDLLAGIANVYSDGLVYFDKTQKTVTSNEAELAAAFAYFNKNVNRAALAADSKSTSQKIRDGRHPVAGLAFAKMGSFMASKLQDKFGAAQLEAYRQAGPIPFFADYVTTYKKDSKFSKAVRFDAAFEKTIAQWQQDWQKTWTPETRSLTITPGSDFDALAAQLQPVFARAQVYPNFVEAFNQSIQQLALRGEREKALKAGKVGVDLYPNSDGLNAYYGIAQIFFGDSENGKAFIKKAAAINANGVAGPNGLNNMAYQLAGIGKVEAGMAILQTAVELYPKEANLYDSIGEFYLKQDQKEKAIEFYQKALQIDPNLASAKSMLEKINAVTVK
jgi:CubicO group peptidase (beta-lactamase class C family)